MISVILLVLKIIGFILLGLFGLLLFGIILILFIPIRYRARGYRYTDREIPLYLEFRITWLMRIVRITAEYYGKLSFSVKVLFFSLVNSQKLKKTLNEEAEAEETGRAEPDGGEAKETGGEKDGKETIKEAEGKGDVREKVPKEDGLPDSPVLSNEKETVQANEDVPDRDKDENKETEAEDDGGAETFLKRAASYISKVIHRIKNIRYTINSIYDKIKAGISNIRHYIGILQSDEFRHVFSLVKKQLIKILKMIKPRRWKADIRFGAGDPALTGQILGILGMLYPVLGNTVVITPEFEELVFEGEFELSGSITMIHMLIIGFILFTDKTLRRLLRMFKTEVDTDG